MELERECLELRRQLAATEHAPTTDAAAFLESLLAAVPAFIMRTDDAMRLLYINRLQAGLKMEEVIGRELWDFLHPDSIEPARSCIEKVLVTGQAGTYEATGTGPDGTPRYYESFVTSLPAPSGGLGVCIVSVDVTQLRLRDLELRRSEEQLRIAVESTGIGLWSWIPATNEVHWYPRTHEVLGRAVPVDLTSYIEVLAHPDDRELLRANTASSIAGGPFSGPIHRVITDDGSIRWILSRGRTELDANGFPARVIGGSLDVTQQHELEEQLRHAQRLDAVGHLTAGVAHNFNNMLTVMLATLEILAKRVAGDNRRLIDGALEAAQRSSEMVRQLMTFTGQRAQPDRHPHAIGPLVEQVVEMCRQTFDRHITLACVVAPDLPRIRCTPNELEQVLMNLLVNSRDAVIDSGRPAPQITVTVDARPAVHGSDARCARITVTDDGVGMTEDVVRQAFDPFFSTKEVGRGTGLGLTTSYAIVRALDGTMTCESSPGVGTSFCVSLPGTAAAELPVEPVPARPVTTRRRVLLVDDDHSVRHAITALLTSEGFDVEAVASGEAGLAHLATRAPIDIILLDRSMPGAPGEAYVPRFRAVAPRIPIMMFTGQAVEPTVAALVDRVILKPVSGAALVEAIEALVEQLASRGGARGPE
ncbi:MAG: response regulator [Deltaproteobacteria bacterium]|nr:response regulator [Deltaproteobacteria bacterium]